MGSSWVNGDFTFDMSDNLLFKKNAENYIDALGIQQLNTIGNIYFLDIYLSEGNSVEFHYHPNASELTYCISGKVEVGFINPNDNEWQDYKLEPGDVVSFPQGFWHYARALTDDTHLLATHDTNNLETIFGSDILRVTPKGLMANIYCLNEAKLTDALAPIQDTVVIGPSAECDHEEFVGDMASMQAIGKVWRQDGSVESRDKDSMDQLVKNQVVSDQKSINLKEIKRTEEVPSEQARYGGRVNQDVHLCESCFRQFVEE